MANLGAAASAAADLASKVCEAPHRVGGSFPADAAKHRLATKVSC